MSIKMLTQTPNIVFQPFYTECLSGMHNIVCKKIMINIYMGRQANEYVLGVKVKAKKSFCSSLNLPYGRRCDGSNEENPAPAEWVRRLEHEDVLEEERV